MQRFVQLAFDLFGVAPAAPAPVRRARAPKKRSVLPPVAHPDSLFPVPSSVPISDLPLVADRPRADAMVTRTPGLALGVLTADCQPVLFADAKAGVVGAAHAGWRGTRDGVLEATVDAMQALGARDISQRAGNACRIVGRFVKPRIQIGGHLFGRAKLLRHVISIVICLLTRLCG